MHTYLLWPDKLLSRIRAPFLSIRSVPYQPLSLDLSQLRWYAYHFKCLHMFSFSVMSVYVCVCVLCLCVGSMHMCVTACGVWRSPLVAFFGPLSPYFMKRGFFLTWSWPDKLGWLNVECWEASCLPVPSTGFTNPCPHTQILYMGSEDETQSFQTVVYQQSYAPQPSCFWGRLWLWLPDM